MNLRKHLVETVTLILAAALCAVIANFMAGRDRKLALVGSYNRASPSASTAASKVPVVNTVPAEPLPAAASPRVVVDTPPPPSPDPAKPVTANPTAVTQPAPKKATVKSAPTAAATPPSLAGRFPPHPDKPYVEIAHDDVAALHASGALFLDARRTSVYNEGHIAGARPFSVWESDVDEKVKRLFDERGDPVTQLQPIVIYCSGGDCEDSHMLADKLWGLQFNNLYVYKDGFPDWKNRNGRVEN